MKKIYNYTAEFASEVLDTIPAGYIDKTLPGCGLSTVALESSTNVILAVPNVELIDNKVSQYPNQRSQHVVFGVKEGITVQDVNDYIESVEVIKIMVTYDSIWKVQHLLDYCHLIIDESQEILKSQKLKSTSKKDAFSEDAITLLLDTAKKYKDTVSFISATPIPLQYMPSWISDLDQIVMNWDDTTVVKPILMKRTYVNKAVRNEIIIPLEKLGEVTIGNIKFKKVVIFINSISGIADIIKKSSINKSDVRVIMGKGVENDVKLRGIARLTEYSNLTKYTFITGAGFKGIDLYDSEAMNIVVSNTSKDYNMIDLTTDLQQSISRIRTKDNPNYGKFFYIYNQAAFEKSKEDLISLMDSNKVAVEKQIKSYDLNKDADNVEGFRYDELFQTYTKYNLSLSTFTFNDNLYQADKYFILETKENYRKGFKLKGSFNNSITVDEDISIPDVSYKMVAENFIDNGNFNGMENQLEYINIIKATIQLYNKVWSNLRYAQEQIEAYNDDWKQVLLAVRNSFKLNERYTSKEVKNRLQKVYNTYGVKRTAKSKDIIEFMSIVHVRGTGGVRFIEITNKNKTTR
jgi:hypothetical protein